MNREDLLALNAEGLIPGPNESQEMFEKRVFETKAFFNEQEDSLPDHYWLWSKEQLKGLFDFSPRWVSASFSSKGLLLWQAAATWINVKRIYFIRLRASSWVSWFVDRNELLSHEAAHAARAAFDESKYEEFFAYLTSSMKWRRVIGPLFRRSFEATLLMGLLLIGGFLQMFEWIFDEILLSQLWLVFAFALLFGWCLRLMRARRQIERAAKRLTKLLRDSSMVRAVLFRMTDREIEQLAKGLPFKPGSDLRWQLIKAAYWKEEYDATDQCNNPSDG